jgi:hypothetical protein
MLLRSAPGERGAEANSRPVSQGRESHVSKQMERRESRYALRGNVPARLTLRRADEPVAQVEARLLDISPGGAKLTLDVALAIDAAAELRLESPELGLDLVVPGRVCWARAEGPRWVLGCAFQPPLPPEALEPFFEHGLLERRRNSRRVAVGRAVARWEMCEGETPVELLDYSTGGFCVRAPQRAQTDGRLLLRLAGPDGVLREVLAKVRWQSAIVGGCVLGCEFQSAEGLRTLRACVPQEAGVPLVSGPTARRLSLFTLVGVVLLLAVVAWQMAMR